MANGYFERGEIYWVNLGSGFMEAKVARPGLIISADKVNASGQVSVAFLTTRTNDRAYAVPTEATGKSSMIKCDSLTTISTSVLGQCIGFLNSAEMREVEDVLEEVFDLGYADDETLKAKEREISDRDAVIAEKDAEIVKLREMVAAAEKKAEDAELSYKIENDMWQKLYDKVLNQVVDMKYTNDLFLKDRLGRKEAKVVPVVTMKEPEPVEPPKVEEQPQENRLDINHCTITALKKLGFSLGLARQIVDRRPYKSVGDLKNVPGMKATQYRIMEPKLCCTPVVEEKSKPKKGSESALVEPDTGYEEPEVVEAPAAPETEVVNTPEKVTATGKVNVNTATWEELTRLVGLNRTTAQHITAYRNKHGKFEKLEDLTQVSRFGKTCLKKYGPMLEV